MNSMYMQTQISELYVPTNSSFFWLALVFASQLGWSRNSQNDAPWMIFDLYYKQIRFAHTSPNTKDKSVIIVQSGPELQSLLSTETSAHHQPPPSRPPQDNNMTIYGYGIPLGTVIPSSTNQLYIDQDVPHHYWISTGLTDVNWTQIDITNADSASYAKTASFASTIPFILYDNFDTPSLDYNVRALINNSNTVVDWGTQILWDAGNNQESVLWDTRQLWDSNAF